MLLRGLHRVDAFKNVKFARVEINGFYESEIVKKPSDGWRELVAKTFQ